MVKPNWSRRNTVKIVAALFAFGAVAAGSSPAAAYETLQPLSGVALAQLRFRAIRVDVSPLAEKGLGPEAAWMAQELPGRLQAAFAGRLAPHDASAPTLVVRIDGLNLGMSGGGGTAPFGATSARDDIEGAGVIVAPNGKTIGSYPLFTSQLDYTGGANYELGTERRRVGELAGSFAQWLPGQMGL
jgi:hypothetical protein